MDIINGVNVDEFIGGYVAAMLWSSTDEEGGSLDGLYDGDDLAPEAVDRCQADCRSFLYRIGYLIKEEHFSGRRPDGGTLSAYAGHDFWLTRCGHGSGFWDGDWTGEELPCAGEMLDRIAKGFGEIDPYVGDDGKVHLS